MYLNFLILSEIRKFSGNYLRLICYESVRNILYVIAHSIASYKKAFEKAFKEFRTTNGNPGVYIVTFSCFVNF